jgi:hypothetical protein
MTVVSSRTFSTNPIHYLNLAVKEDVTIRRGKTLFQITPKPQFENLSPSYDPYFANPENVAELERRIEEIKDGKVKFKVLTKEKQKELLGI